MGTFGQAVGSLLDTYSDCLALLKRSSLGSGSQSAQTAEQPAPARLAQTLHSDRASIRRAYSSRLSENGSHVDKGDAAARSRLRRVIKRLTEALADVIRTLSRRKPHSVDYDSLMSLSRVSSMDAIRTINDLAHRLGSDAGSRRSVASSGHRRERPGSYHHSHHADQQNRHSRRDDGMRSKKSNPTDQAAPRHQRHPQRKQTATKSLKSSASLVSSTSLEKGRHRRQESEKRVSLHTLSSDSTKLGEIRLRRSRLEMNLASRIAYPLYPYQGVAHEQPVLKVKRKRWGLFGGLNV